MIEIARLQNALLHSIPVAEYNRLLKEHKTLLHRRVFVEENPDSDVDVGYQSNEEQPLDDQQFSIAISAFHLSQRREDELLARMIRLEETNRVLNAQNEFWTKETQKLNAQIAELEAFLNDIENETEMKSMIGE